MTRVRKCDLRVASETAGTRRHVPRTSNGRLDHIFLQVRSEPVRIAQTSVDAGSAALISNDLDKSSYST
jgi:hypothetical protein